MMHRAARALILVLLLGCSGAPRQRPVWPRGIQDLFARAEKARKEGRAEEALQLFQSLLAQAPEHVDGHLGYQRLLRYQGKREELNRRYREMLDAQLNPEHLFLYARLLDDLGRQEDLYRKGLNLDPTNPWLLEALARSLRYQRRFPEAIAVSESLLRLEDTTSSHVDHLRLLKDAGRLSNYQDRYRARAEANPADPEAQLLYGWLLGHLEQWDEARSCFERAARLAPQDQRPPLALGQIAAMTQDLEKAMEFLEKARRLDPLNSGVLVCLGTILFARKEPRGVDLIEQAVRIEPEDPDLQCLLGGLRSVQGDKPAAEACVREALRLHPNHHQSLSQQAHLQLAQGRIDEAIELSRRAIQMEPLEAQYHSTLAEAYGKAGKKDLAMAELELARSLNTKFAFIITGSGKSVDLLRGPQMRSRALVRLAEALLGENKPQEALDRLNEAVQVDPKHLRAQLGVARIVHRIGRPAEALKAYQSVREAAEKVKPEYVPGISVRIAECLYDLNRVEEANRLYLAVHTKSAAKIPRSEGLEEIVSAIRSASSTAGVFRIPGVRIGESALERACAPNSLFAVLRHWNIPCDISVLSRELGWSQEHGTRIEDIATFLQAKSELAGIFFVGDADLLKRLLSQGRPIVLFYRMLIRDQYAYHASTLVGYDDRRGLFLLEDTNWFSGRDKIPFAQLKNCWALLAGPANQLTSEARDLPHQEFMAKLLKAFAAVSGNDLDSAAEHLGVALSLKGDDPLAHTLYGGVLAGRQKLDQAVSAYEKACALGADADAYSRLARLRWKRGDVSGAERDLRAAIERDPDYMTARIWLAELLELKGERDSALEECAKALDRDPHSAKVLALSGGLRLNMADFAGAVEDCTKAIDLEPNEPEAYRYRSGALAQQGDLPAAMRDASRSLELKPDAWTFGHRAQLKARAGDVDGALEDAGRAIEIDTKFAGAYLIRAYLKEKKKGDLDGAEADYTKAIELDPKDARAYLSRGSVKDDKGLYDEAIADYTKAIELDPKDAAAYYSRGITKKAKGLLDEAIADYTKAIELDPKDVKAYYNRGSVKDDKGSYDEAIADYTRAIELDPKYAKAYSGRGWARKCKGLLDQAIADFDRVIELDPKHFWAFFNRGSVKDDKGLYDEAIADYTKAIELNPKHAGAHRHRGIAKKAKGLFDEAIADYTKAIELEPKDPAPYYSRGIAKKAKGLLDEAIADYTKAIELKPRFAEAYSNRGAIRDDKGLYDEAIADFRKALEVASPEWSYRPSIQKLLKSSEAKLLFREANGLLEKKEHQAAIEKFKSLVETYSNTKHAIDSAYNIARGYALLGEKSNALNWLEKAVEMGWKEVARIEKDSDLESLRGEERYRNVLESLKKK